MAAASHGHDHTHGGHGHSAWGAAMWLALGILVVEVAGGLASHSLALWSDAAHMLTDVLSLGLAAYAARLAARGPTSQHSYGFHRAGILAALANAALLILIAAAVLVEAVARLRHPGGVTPSIMAIVAAAALAGNLAIGARLEHAGDGHGRHDLNARGAWLHVMGDAGASAGVLVAGLLIAVTHRLWWDPVASAAIALLIAWGAVRLVRGTTHVLMEGTPPGIEPGVVAAAIATDPAVRSVHHLHVWSLDGQRLALSGHVVVGDVRLSETEGILRRVGAELQRRFGIAHSTLQLECGTSGAPCPQGDCGETHES